jgi:hypothetical protein
MGVVQQIFLTSGRKAGIREYNLDGTPDGVGVWSRRPSERAPLSDSPVMEAALGEIAQPVHEPAR